MIAFSPGRENFALPSEQARANNGPPRRRELLQRLYPMVRDVIERRSDGRSLAAEPFEAFGERLSGLGYGHFRAWWVQTVTELRRLDLSLNPVIAAVLSAALVEGALAFVVRHARQLGLGVLGSKTFDGSPQTWKIDDLVSSASSGGASAILDQPARHRADALIKVRQRIHAGRMLSDYPGGVPDLRPEESRDARQTAELVVRRILDWLDRNPPNADTSSKP